MSCNNVPIFKGKVSADRNCLEARRLLLAEMTARAAKNMLRQLLRTSSTQNRVATHQTQVIFVGHAYVNRLPGDLNENFHTIMISHNDTPPVVFASGVHDR